VPGHELAPRKRRLRNSAPVDFTARNVELLALRELARENARGDQPPKDEPQARVHKVKGGFAGTTLLPTTFSHGIRCVIARHVFEPEFASKKMLGLGMGLDPLSGDGEVLVRNELAKLRPKILVRTAAVPVLAGYNRAENVPRVRDNVEDGMRGCKLAQAQDRRELRSGYRMMPFGQRTVTANIKHV